MNGEAIRLALENAVGVPEAAVQDAASLAPAVITVAQRMADGAMPLPREERLLRFGLFALAAARETSACPALLALLKLPALELEWLFGDDRGLAATQLLLGLFDGDDAAVGALVADPAVDDEVRSALMTALARLVWERRAPRERLLDLLDRFDRELAADPRSLTWLGWQEAILLLGLTDWAPRVQRGWDAGRLPWLQDDVDRQDWAEQVGEAAAHPEAPERFVERRILPIEDPAVSVGWSADAPSGPGEAPTGDEMAWMELLLWRRIGKGTMCLEETDGFLTALAVGPVRVPPAEFLPAIRGEAGDPPLFDTPEHDALAAELLIRHHAAIETALGAATAIAPAIGEAGGELTGALWARGFMRGVTSHQAAWEKLSRQQRVARRVLAPIEALTPGMAGVGPVEVTPEIRATIVRALPGLVRAISMFWRNGEAALPSEAPPERVRKVGRNQPCPCGSGKKYKRCCGLAA